MEQEVAAQVVALGGTTDFSLIHLFLRADFIVKSVIIILIAASVYSWALIFEKYKLFKKIEKSTTIFEEKFWKSRSAESFYNSLTNKEKNPVANIFQTAMAELIKTKSKSSSIQLARVSRMIEISADNEIKSIEKHFTFLATVGSTAPFIGLFGTVWGIMNSFQSIAISRNTSLAIVAPGIAEALFATALGLLAAIPAVIAYNKFNSDSKKFSARIENFSKRFLSII
ncbi:MAG: biopolymer transport protein TolQ [Pelagibacterales bacterium]|jgi:biopolymer transport protein TolQ|nr:biopolymer transport protein TolQ [Pelagibacterales bacterium]